MTWVHSTNAVDDDGEVWNWAVIYREFLDCNMQQNSTLHDSRM